MSGRTCSRGWAGRCPAARGPKCTCACGGENHGNPAARRHNQEDRVKLTSHKVFERQWDEEKGGYVDTRTFLPGADQVADIHLIRNEEWRKLEWADCDPESSGCIPEEERYAASRHYDIGPKHELEYTPELWAALLDICTRLAQARKTLDDMVSTKAGVALLREVGAGKQVLLLGGGGK